ncbi:hypothetical protein FRC14_001715 [Serendipita sp. 396]|nr:hypothetical protein FRC14_001715 [Serendipita sp. 396]
MSQRTGTGYKSDDAVHRTGLDVFTNQDHTAPPPGYDKTNNAGQEARTVWSYYDEKGHHFDADLVGDSNNTVEVLLIFAGLFSAVVSAFISQTYPMLKPDPVDTLGLMLQELRKPGSVPEQHFVIPAYAVRVNCFLFAGLFVSMIVALLSILVKQWTRSYQRHLAGISSPHLRARIRHFRYYGVKRWHLAGIVGLLSIFMHFALFVSAVGIIDLLLATAPTVGYVALSMFVPGALFFLITTLIPLFVLDAPFRSPLSNLLVKMKRSIHLPEIQRQKNDDIEMSKEGLEDQVENTQEIDIGENKIVRTKVDLDLDILTHLLSVADKSTERWLLDLCFEKLPKLAILEQQDPESILRREIILEVYIFLAKGCIDTQGSRKEIKPDRLMRARQLCEFIAWFLSLPRSTATRTRLRQQLSKGYDPMELPNALATDTSSASLLPAITAQARLEHLFDQEADDGTCTVCDKATGKLLNLRGGVQKDREQRSQVITSFIISHSDCLSFHAKAATGPPGTGRTSMCSQSLRHLTDTLSLVSVPTGKEKAEWINLVKQRREKSHPNLHPSWFNKLAMMLDGLETTSGSSRRTPSPSQMAAGTSTGGGNALGLVQGGRSPSSPSGQLGAHSNSSLLPGGFGGRVSPLGSNVKIAVKAPSQDDFVIQRGLPSQGDFLSQRLSPPPRDLQPPGSPPEM